MTVNVSSPITGTAQTGLTSPTYTLTTDIAPDSNGKQVAVTALGGTQAGVTSHSVASPFTHTVTRPKSLKTLGQPNPVTGVVSNIGRNSYKLITRKGAVPLAGQAPVVALVTTQLDIPAGTDLASPAEIRAAISSHIGYLSQVSSGLGDTCVSGVL